MDHRQTMLEHLDAIERALNLTTSVPWRGFLAQRTALIAVDEWLRGQDPPPDPLLTGQFGMSVVALLLAVEDVLRLFPDDAEQDPAVERAATLAGSLLTEMREILTEDQPDKPIVH